MRVIKSDRPGKQISVIGHRGIRRNGVENTIGSFRRSVELGATWVEMDIQIIRDEIVVYHDSKLNGRPLADYSLSEIREFRYSNGETIPTFTDVIEAIDAAVGLVVELKVSSVSERLSDALRDLNRGREIIVSSFHYPAVMELKKNCPEIVTGIISDAYLIDVLREMELVGATVLYQQHELLDHRLVSLIQESGRRICPWTVNDESDIKRMVELGVDGIISDYPERVREQVEG